MGINYKYQLVFLGDVECEALVKIRTTFFSQLSSLGLDTNSVIVIDSTNISAYSNKQPSFVYYFGNTDLSKDNEFLQVLVNNGEPIFPLYFQDSFEKEIPNVIRVMNGRKYDSSSIEEYVNYALESFRLLRDKRRVFISYKRSDASAVAGQLYEALIKRNYDAFLDTYSIKPGEPFQEELFHRMSDSDVLIQLYTKDFKQSDWCIQEIQTANTHQIGVVEIVWPEMILDSHNHLCTSLNLEFSDFNALQIDADSKLKDNTIQEICTMVESVRARNLAARQDNLIGEFVSIYQKYGHQLLQRYNLLIDEQKTHTYLFVPAIGVPQGYDCYRSLEFKQLLSKDSLEIYLLYDDLKIRQKWIDYLEWLNGSLEVKTIKKRDFEKWIRKM